MSPSKKASLTLSVALILLCFSGFAAAFTIVRLYEAESLVSHTYSVEVALGDLESSLADVGRHRIAYVDTGKAADLSEFNAAAARVPAALARIHDLVHDSPTQLALCYRLDANANDRLAPSIRSVEMRKQGDADPATHSEFTAEVARGAFETAAISQQMRDNEDRLLQSRSQLSQTLFTATIAILIASFGSSAFMFWIHYRLLDRELRERGAAENRLRQLSGQLMRVQDEERKRFARELHDGLGQDIVAAKIAADVLVARYPRDLELTELSAMLTNSLSQTRAISYLLHPPLLEEMGLASAAQWLVEGYAKRTGLAVSFQISPQTERLPRQLEITVFRILQEALVNIYRHAKSAKAEVSIQVGASDVRLCVKDDGKGMSHEMLASLKSGSYVGVGLAGMRERVTDAGGKLEIKSDKTGTQIIAMMPIVADVNLPADAVTQ